MQLDIEVKKHKENLSEKKTFTFGVEGGVIGRSEDCDFVLNDNDLYASSWHATIQFEDGVYYLKDHSTNGTVVNNILYHGNKAPLLHGDSIEIGDYILKVAITGTSEASHGVADHNITPDISADPFAVDLKNLNTIHVGDETPAPDSDDLPHSDNMLKPLKVFSGGYSPNDCYIPPQLVESGKSPADVSDFDDLFLMMETESIAEKFVFPSINPPSSHSPSLLSAKAHSKSDGIDLDRELPDIGPKPTTKPDQANPVDKEKSLRTPKDNAPSDILKVQKPSLNHVKTEDQASKEDMADEQEDITERLHSKPVEILLTSLGIVDEKTVSPEEVPEFMKMIGTVFFEMVDGLKRLLQARTEVKSHIGVRNTTTIEKNQNNPFKFLPTVEDVLKQLLMDKNSGYKSGIDAVREGFNDIENHQIASAAATQSTLNKLLNLLNPERFENRYKNTCIRKKVKCWKAYCEAYDEIVKQTPKSFIDTEYVDAYEKIASKIEREKKDL